MALSCFDGIGLDDGWRMRLLAALARECADLGEAICTLGDRVTAGDAGIADLQGFDAQSQAAHALCALLDGLCGSRRDFVRQVDQVPLPGMRRRLRAALDHHGGAQDAPPDPGGDIIWLDAP